MHGLCHDFVVANTVLGGYTMPTGNGGGAPVSEFVDQKNWPVLKEQPRFKRILEIGSLDICGSMRDYNFINSGPQWVALIGNPEYVGIDITPGRGVDIVMDAHEIKFPDNSFDFVMCLEMLEHDTDPQKTLQEAYRVLSPKGLFLLATVDERHPEHGSGPDGFYRRLTVKELQGWLKKAGFKDITLYNEKDGLDDIFVRATK